MKVETSLVATGRVDRAEVNKSHSDAIVVEQFVWEVGETLELIRNVTMAGSHIDGMTVAEVASTCIDNLLAMGSAFEFDGFLEAVHDLAGVLRIPDADGSLIDHHIGAVVFQSGLVP